MKLNDYQCKLCGHKQVDVNYDGASHYFKCQDVGAPHEDYQMCLHEKKLSAPHVIIPDQHKATK